MKNQQNVDESVALGLDFIGNIFFDKSPRNLSSIIDTSAIKVGVFVKESLVVIKEKIVEHNLTVIQLHGGESNDFCKAVKGLGVEVWKVLSIGDDFEPDKLKEFPFADKFLFDTKTEEYGGTGRKFDWTLLNEIDKKTPKQYFLAGGICSNDAKEIKELELEKIFGLDLNSRFESSPGVKNVEELKKFLNELRG